MIINEELIVQYLAQWISDYAKENGRQTFVIVDNATRQSDLVKLICSECTKNTGGFKSMLCHTNHIDAHKISEETFGIVIGLIDKTFGLYYRGYSKLDEGLGDIFPLFDLEYSEIIQITDKLIPNNKYNDSNNYQMIEFCNKANTLYGIITDDNVPNKNNRWPYFITEQKKWLGIVHQREKSTRHKAINRPYPKIPEMLCRRSEL